MTDQHVYEDEQAQRLADFYTSPATVDRREWQLGNLDLTAGESVLSIGCGPGYEPAAIAEWVGEGGRVSGVDNSNSLLAMAEDHCVDAPQVTFEHADASNLPFTDGSFDVGTASFVYEYVPEVDSAVAELARCLRPGGRAAIIAADWDSVVWHSSDTNRMNLVMEAWKDMYANPSLGSQLMAPLREAELEIDSIEAGTYLETDLDSFGGFLFDLVKGYIEEGDEIDPETIEAWERDLRMIDEAGETFLSLTYYLYLVRKPA